MTRAILVFIAGFCAAASFSAITGCTAARGAAAYVTTKTRIALGLKRATERRPPRWRYDWPLNGH